MIMFCYATKIAEQMRSDIDQGFCDFQSYAKIMFCALKGWHIKCNYVYLYHHMNLIFSDCLILK